MDQVYLRLTSYPTAVSRQPHCGLPGSRDPGSVDGILSYLDHAARGHASPASRRDFESSVELQGPQVKSGIRKARFKILFCSLEVSTFLITTERQYWIRCNVFGHGTCQSGPVGDSTTALIIPAALAREKSGLLTLEYSSMCTTRVAADAANHSVWHEIIRQATSAVA